MSDKLDFLAKKEEELKKLNDMLNSKNKDIKAHRDTKESFNNANKYDTFGHEEEGDDDPQEEDKDDYGREEDEAEFERRGKTKNQDDLYEGLQEEEIENAQAYQDLLEKNREYEGTIAYQKARIEALQGELETAISTINTQEIHIKEFENKGKSIGEESKRYTAQINQLNTTIQKVKGQNTDLMQKMSQLEKENAEFKKDVEVNKRDKKKNEQDTSNKDVKLNRLLEK